MADYLLAFKCFGLCVVLALVFFISSRFVSGWRIAFSKMKFTPFAAEIVLLLIAILFGTLSLLCLLWGFVAWIAS